MKNASILILVAIFIYLFSLTIIDGFEVAMWNWSAIIIAEKDRKDFLSFCVQGKKMKTIMMLSNYNDSSQNMLFDFLLL